MRSVGRLGIVSGCLALLTAAEVPCAAAQRPVSAAEARLMATIPELKEIRNFQHRPAEIEAHISGNAAWGILRYAVRASMGERAIDAVGRGTAVLERRGQRWVVRHTHTRSRARRPTDPPTP